MRGEKRACSATLPVAWGDSGGFLAGLVFMDRGEDTATSKKKSTAWCVLVSCSANTSWCGSTGVRTNLVSVPAGNDSQSQKIWMILDVYHPSHGPLSARYFRISSAPCWSLICLRVRHVRRTPCWLEVSAILQLDFVLGRRFPGLLFLGVKRGYELGRKSHLKCEVS